MDVESGITEFQNEEELQSGINICVALTHIKM
jgi:hypothetical protein